jgi:hypothetical protein
LVFNQEGKFIKVIGRKGRGPGDIYFPIWMEIYKNDIYIKNNNGIDIFAEDSSYIKRIRTFFTFPRFIVADDSIYCVTRGMYREKFPLILKLNLKGNVIDAFYTPDLNDPLFKISKEGDVLIIGDEIAFVSNHWNRIYFFNRNSKALKRIKVKYELLDEVEKWNARNLNRKKKNVTWFSNMIASAKSYRGKIYLLVNNPRLEIISIDTAGNVREHFYNHDDFRFMRWFDFVVREEQGRLVFLVMGLSIGEEKKKDLSEMNVYRLYPLLSTK